MGLKRERWNERRYQVMKGWNKERRTEGLKEGNKEFKKKEGREEQ